MASSDTIWARASGWTSSTWVRPLGKLVGSCAPLDPHWVYGRSADRWVTGRCQCQPRVFWGPEPRAQVGGELSLDVKTDDSGSLRPHVRQGNLRSTGCGPALGLRASLARPQTWLRKARSLWACPLKPHVSTELDVGSIDRGPVSQAARPCQAQPHQTLFDGGQPSLELNGHLWRYAITLNGSTGRVVQGNVVDNKF